MSEPAAIPPAMNDADLITAATRLRTEMDVVEATVLSGAAWRLISCSPGCNCVERRAEREALGEDLARLGLKMSSRPPFEFRVDRGPRGRTRHRDLQVLLELTVWLLRPSVVEWCETRSAPVRAGYGISCYDRWIDDWPEPRADIAGRAPAWSTLRRVTASWLSRRAGRQRTPYAVRLRRAASAFQEEADALQLLERNPRDEDHVHRAADNAWVALEAIVEAALMETGILPAIRGVLLEGAEAPLTGMALQEMVYMARAGSRPLRVLAARRLAGGRGPQVTATLGQLLWEDYAPLSDTAIWALGIIDAELMRRIVTGVVRGMAQENPGALRVPLLSAAEPDCLDEIVTSLAEAGTLEALRPEVRAWRLDGMDQRD